jgi:hypothetical protein
MKIETRECTELLAQYTNRGNNQKEVFTMTYVLTSLMHPYVITGTRAHLFINIRDSKNNLVAKHAWLNDNRTIYRMELQPGDRIVGQWWAEQYWYSNNYHQNNVRRTSNKNYYRFLFPEKLHKIGTELIPKQRILNLKDLSIHDDFDSIFKTNVTAEVYWLSFIQLTDNCHLWNLQKVNKQYPPEYVLLSKWKQLSQEEREKILKCRNYTHPQILEYEKMMKNI